MGQKIKPYSGVTEVTGKEKPNSNVNKGSTLRKTRRRSHPEQTRRQHGKKRNLRREKRGGLW